MGLLCKLSTHYDVYHPINQLKPVSTDIWVVDGDVINFKGVGFPTRMTVIRLNNGGLFIHSPTELTEPLKAQIDALGSVEHLVSPNRIHYWWIGQWGKAYPSATKWASPNVNKAIEPLDWQFDQSLIAQEPPLGAMKLISSMLPAAAPSKSLYFFISDRAHCYWQT